MLGHIKLTMGSYLSTSHVYCKARPINPYLRQSASFAVTNEEAWLSGVIVCMAMGMPGSSTILLWPFIRVILIKYEYSAEIEN